MKTVPYKILRKLNTDSYKDDDQLFLVELTSTTIEEYDTFEDKLQATFTGAFDTHDTPGCEYNCYHLQSMLFKNKEHAELALKFLKNKNKNRFSKHQKLDIISVTIKDLKKSKYNAWNNGFYDEGHSPYNSKIKIPLLTL